MNHERHTASSRAGDLSREERPWLLIDVNVSLFQWPFRRLPHDSPRDMVRKLMGLQVDQAWAGSFEAVLHSDLDAVNRRLAESCRDHGGGRLLAFGSVNPTLPDWKEDLRRCAEVHRMKGIRLHPNYHGYRLEDPRFAELLREATRRQLVVELAVSLEDRRTQHHLLQVPDVDLAPLAPLVPEIPQVRLVLLNQKLTAPQLRTFAGLPGIYFDTARVERTDGISNLLQAVGPDRVVFGSHAPFLIPESASIRVYESEPSLDDCRAIFQNNAQRLITFQEA